MTGPERGRKQEYEDRDDAHLQDLNDGIGCTEIWETLSEQRSERLSEPDPAAD